MYRVRVEDRQGDRWSYWAHTVQEALEIAGYQRVKIIWLRWDPKHR